MNEPSVSIEAPDTGMDSHPVDTPTGDVVALTYREHQVLKRVARGRTNAEIGLEIGLSDDTVKTHLRKVFRKLGARDRAHAVALAYQGGLLGRGSRPNGEGAAPYVVFVAAEFGSRRADGLVPPLAGAPTGMDEVRQFEQALGSVLRILRQQRGWTLEETGRPAGISVSVLCRLELGERSLDIEKLINLCAALGIAPAELLVLTQDTAYPRGWPHRMAVESATPFALEQGT